MTKILQDKMEEIHRHALEEYPYECCGILIGKSGTDQEDILFRCKNIQNELHKQDPQKFVRDARTAFFIDPKELMNIQRQTEEKGMHIKMFYHSHPDHDAYFSEEDRRMALFDGDPLYPEARYLVVSVREGKIKDQVLFSFNEETRDFEPLLS